MDNKLDKRRMLEYVKIYTRSQTVKAWLDGDMSTEDFKKELENWQVR